MIPTNPVAAWKRKVIDVNRYLQLQRSVINKQTAKEAGELLRFWQPVLGGDVELPPELPAADRARVEELRAEWTRLRAEIDEENERIEAIRKGRAWKPKPKPATIQHEILGELAYHHGRMGWAGYILVPAFTRTYDKETFEAIQKHETERSWRFQCARRYPEGMLRLLIKAAEGDEPSREQVRSFQHLVENEAEVYRKVLAALVDCDARWSGRRKPEVVAAEVFWEEVACSRHSTSKGYALVAFGIEGIDIEHQLNVRYDPAKRSASWELENEVLDEFLNGDQSGNH